MLEIRPDDPDAPGGLLDAQAYRATLPEQ
jgi:hypothetical protein